MKFRIDIEVGKNVEHMSEVIFGDISRAMEVLKRFSAKVNISRVQEVKQKPIKKTGKK